MKYIIKVKKEIFFHGICSCFDILIHNLKHKKNAIDHVNLVKKITWAVSNFLASADKINLALLDSNILKNLIDIAVSLNNVKVSKVFI